MGKISFETPLFLVEKRVPLKDITDVSVSLKLKTQVFYQELSEYNGSERAGWVIYKNTQSGRH